MTDYTPLPVPTIPANEAAERVKLTDQQEEQRKEVLAHFDNVEFRIPGEEKGELMDEEKMWLSNECFLRYLRATKWVTATAIQRIEDTLKWRRSYGLYDERQSAEHVEPESVTGKTVLFGYDTKGRPAYYMIPSRQNTTVPEQQLQYSTWCMERSIDLMGPGVETVDLLINFADKAKNPSMSTARAYLNIIQSHYPERLGMALVINIPFLVNAFLKLVMPFVDPVTRSKVKLNTHIFDEGFFTRDQVMDEWWGGDRHFEWDHKQYWPALVKMCGERRRNQMQRWRELGAKVGTSEWDMKTGWAQTGASAAEIEPALTEKRVEIEVETSEVKPATEVEA